MKKKCIIVGSGTYGQVYARYLADLYDEIVFSDNDASSHNTEVYGNKVVGCDDYVLQNLDPTMYDAYVPLGNVKVRRFVINQFREKGFNLPNYIHPSVKIDKSIELGGQAIYILENTTLMPYVKIENEVMISVGTIISHHTTIKSGVFISFGVNVGASLVLQQNSYLGIGSIIMTGVNEVGENSVIGAGAVVIRDVSAMATVVGNPARVIKSS